MEHIRIDTVSEADFDSVIADAGGTRISEEDSADYLLHEAVVELKLVEEEGFEKSTRQKKIADLFRTDESVPPVVVIDPKSLSPELSRKYYNIVAGPIQTHVKKAARQLKKTRKRFPQTTTSVLILFNNGYTALAPEEFESICLKCVRWDTEQIDWVVVGGVYLYGDKIDNYLISPFKPSAVNVASAFPSAEPLCESWERFLGNRMTEFMRGGMRPSGEKRPIVDLVFELDGTRFVKPSPHMGRSKFWPEGRRPRENSTGINSCPPVAGVLPSLDADAWARLSDLYPSADILRSSHEDWLDWVRDEMELPVDPLMPLIPEPVGYDEYMKWLDVRQHDSSIDDLFEFAVELFRQRLIRMIECRLDSESLSVAVPEFIHLIVREIGQDRANDMCSIYYVSELPGLERQEPIAEDLAIFFEYGIALAAAHAIRRGVSTVVFTKDERHKWD